MSIYRELRSGPVRATISRPYGMSTPTYRADTIIGRLNAARSRSDRRVRRYGDDRRRHRPHSRDRGFEMSRVDENRRNEIEDLEKELKEEDETRHVDDATLDGLKKDVLLVESVDLHIEENAEKHHTDLYECTERKDDPQLVVRRGEEFKITFTFQRPWAGKQDDMYLTFKIGEEPNPRKGTFIKIKLEEEDDTSYKEGDDKTWGARIEGQEGNSLTVAVYSPPDVVIGEWEYSVRTVRTQDKEEYEYEGNDDIIVLFNPWCKDDQTYMENLEDLDEYILNENGIVFNGSYDRIGSKPWLYGQFQEDILEASLHVLRKANDYTISAQMGDPVFVSRSLSRILNDCDDNGVLSGRWDGDYSDGTRPTTWKGSVPILKEYMETKQPVKYGQCWVFSHLFTTVGRALGLPIRSVTNFSSAHDTDLTMTIDKYVDDEGDEVEYKSGDSVWNFHVWNEVWMRRPDLDQLFDVECKYDGWHAVDATPQEISDSVFQCGPSPLSAIKNGEVHVGYDTKFIFAEVNADCCTWKDGNPPTLLSKITNRVGKNMSTKHPNGSTVGRYFGDDDGVRLDVTDLYKYDEGSASERAAVEKATRQGKFGKILFENKTGVTLTILEDDEAPFVGEDFTVKVKVENAADEKRSVRLRTTVRPTNYWGGLLGKEKVAFEIYSEDQIPPGEDKIYDLRVDADDYLRLCDEHLSMRVLALANVRGFDDPVFGSSDIVMPLPLIRCQGPSEALESGEEFEVELSFSNPLKNKSLTGCLLRIEGTVEVSDGQGFKKKHAVYVKELSDIKPGKSMTLKVKAKPSIKPKKSRDREMDVGLVSNELPDLEGCLPLELRL